MEQKIIVKHVNGLKRCHSIISEVGDLSHELTFDVVLAPGDLERTLMMFKQRIPVIMEITSPQSKMDLVIAVVLDPEQKPAPVEKKVKNELPEGINFDATAKLYRVIDGRRATTNLCNTCQLSPAECKSKTVEFGEAETHDNVVVCDIYQTTGAALFEPSDKPIPEDIDPDHEAMIADQSAVNESGANGKKARKPRKAKVSV